MMRVRGDANEVIILNTKIMEVDIPIIVTRTTAQHYPPFFKPPNLPDIPPVGKSKRALSLPSGKHLLPNSSSQQHPNPLPQSTRQPRHQPSHPLRTVEMNRPLNIEKTHLQTMEQSSRKSRRISSSAASKRFPKDFFKEENNHPLRSVKMKHKQYQPVTFLETFGKKNFATVETASPQKQAKVSGKDKENKWSSTPVEHLIEQQREKNRFQQKGQDLINKNSPSFGPIPLLPTFNLTIGQKEALGHLIAKKQQIKSRRQEKENNQSVKGDIFRIRKRMHN